MVLWWIGRKLTIIPAVGLGFGAGGAFLGTYDISYKTLTSFIRVDESTRKARAVKYTCAGLSGGLFMFIRELYVPRYDLGPKPTNWKESLARSGRLLANFPWRYRLVSVFGSGIVAAVGSVMGLRTLMAPTNAPKTAPTPTLKADAADAEAAAAAVEEGEVNQAEVMHTEDVKDVEPPLEKEEEVWHEFEKAQKFEDENNE